MYARQASDAIASHLYAKALAENEKRFRAYVTATSDVVYIMSQDWSEMRRLSGLASFQIPSLRARRGCRNIFRQKPSPMFCRPLIEL
jgi:hypothetical protein